MPYVNDSDLFEQIENVLPPVGAAPVKYAWFHDELEKEISDSGESLYAYLDRCRKSGVSEDVIRLWMLKF